MTDEARHPHKPTPIVVNEVEHTLVLRESKDSFRDRARQTVLDASDRPLYDLLMEVFDEADTHCPDFMPAALADHCDDLVEAREAVMDIERGRAHFEGYAQYGISYCHNVRDAIDEWRDRPPARLVVVGCSASKHDVDEAVPAADLYNSAYWTCKQDYAEAIADDWRICSAKHALLDPEEPIAYYDRSVDDLESVPVHTDIEYRLPDASWVQTKLDQWAAEVYDQLTTWLMHVGAHGSVDPRDVELEVLLGRRYRDPLEERGVFDRLRSRGALEISFPFQEEEQAQGGNGNQMDWMTDRVGEVSC